MAATAQAGEMLTAALEMERKGKAFYDRAIATCSNALGREVFTTLRDDEIVHLKRIEWIYKSASGGIWREDWTKAGEGHAELALFFEELARRTGPRIGPKATDLEALEVGLRFEERSIQFYQRALSQASDLIERGFLERMVAEERSHFAVLTDMKSYLSDPASYFAEKERSSYDGA